MTDELDLPPRVGSLFSGIGGLDLGLERAGFRIAWQVEIDPFCRKVLEKHWPEVPKYGDVREVKPNDLQPVDVICGGFPCQDVSVAGKRKGLAGEQSGLFFEFVRIVAGLSPAWVLIENVPGLLSSQEGRDFQTVLDSLVELGYCVAWRILDAQYFGVAQRRRRVFLVGSFRNAGAIEVLFEPESVCWDTAPSRETGKNVARTVTTGVRIDGETETFVTDLAHALAFSRTQNHLDPSQQTYVLGFRNEDLAHALRSNPSKADKPDSSTYIVAPTLCTKNDVAGSSTQRWRWMEQSAEVLGIVRRLTPTECERLQGFPDGWTLVDNQTPDSPRYRALGNAVCVNVAAWIGRRLMEVIRYGRT